MIRIVTALLVAAALAPSIASAAVISFDYSGTGATGGFTNSTGSFSYQDESLSSVTLADLTTFTLRQTVSSATGSAVAIFNFAKSDLISFAVSLTGGQVTSAAFETDFNVQTSSPTNSQFKSQNFIALSAASGKTQYRDHLFPTPPPPADDTTGPVTFSGVPEPSTGVSLLIGLTLWWWRTTGPGTAGRRPATVRRAR